MNFARNASPQKGDDLFMSKEKWPLRCGQVRELTLTVEKLTVENANRRKELDDLITDTQAERRKLGVTGFFVSVVQDASWMMTDDEDEDGGDNDWW